MNPITHYNILFSRLEKEHREGRAQDRWYIFLLMNRNKITPSGSDLINNYSYMDDRTENVTFHIPGYFKDFRTYLKNDFACDIVEAGGKQLYFDRDGFQSTVNWLEWGSGGHYRYSENLDLVVVRYRHEKAGQRVEDGFCLSDLVAYNLDRLDRDGVNTLGFINCCKNAVHYASSEAELRQMLEYHIMEASRPACVHAGQDVAATGVADRYVLVAGSSRVQTECDTVVSTLNRLSERSVVRYSVKSVSLETIRSSGGAEYVPVPFHDADKVFFVLDGHENDMTVQEFTDAVGSILGHKPVLVYGKKKRGFFGYAGTPGQLARLIRDGLQRLAHSYTEFRDERELSERVTFDFLHC